MNNSRSELTQLYLELTKTCPINQLGPPYVYYYANEMKTNVLGYDCLDIDVKSAFPTICLILFGKEHQFVKNIFSIEDKLKRNIYISTTLTNQTKIDGYPYISELNLWSKMLILCYAYSHYQDLTILEYVKDGLILKGISKPLHGNDLIFQSFIEKYNILFHEEKVSFYIRFNKTSIIKRNDKLKIKGFFHDPPSYLIECIDYLLNGNIYDIKFLNNLKEKYTNLFLDIIKMANLSEELKTYYAFNGSKYITIDGKLSNSLSDCYPKAYLTEFIFPILALLRIQMKQESSFSRH